MKAIIDFAFALASARAYEQEPVTFYLVEPLILGPDGWMAFENPTKQVLEARFSAGGDKVLDFTGGAEKPAQIKPEALEAYKGDDNE